MGSIMRIELIVIGDEILRGAVQDANTKSIATILAKEGFFLSKITAVSDNRNEMAIAIDDAMSRADVVLTTGGLGPTVDDITKDVIAEYAGVSLTVDEKTYEFLKARYGKDFPEIEQLAMVPEGVEVLLNQVGIAPSFIYSPSSAKKLIALPGVPRELQWFASNEVLPLLKKNYPQKIGYYRDLLSFLFLKENDIDPTIRQLQEEFPEIQFGIYPDNPAFGMLSLILSSTSLAKDDFFQARLPVIKALKQKYPKNLFRTPTGLIEEAIHLHFIESDETIALAESCTGGSIASRLTKFPGASDYFLGSFVTYSNSMKKRVLGVSEGTLAAKGAVSVECAEEMLAGIFKHSDANWGLSVTGVAGPTGGSDEKPVGTVYYALGKRGERIKSGLLSPPPHQIREAIIQRTGTHLLGYLWQMIHE